MTLDTIIEQLRTAKARNLILRATVSVAMLPASVVIQLPHTTSEETLDKLKEFFRATFPHTTIQQWRYALPRDDQQDDMNIICVSFTVDYMHLKHGAAWYGPTPLSI